MYQQGLEWPIETQIDEAETAARRCSSRLSTATIMDVTALLSRFYSGPVPSLTCRASPTA